MVEKQNSVFVNEFVKKYETVAYRVSKLIPRQGVPLSKAAILTQRKISIKEFISSSWVRDFPPGVYFICAIGRRRDYKALRESDDPRMRKLASLRSWGPVTHKVVITPDSFTIFKRVLLDVRKNESWQFIDEIFF